MPVDDEVRALTERAAADFATLGCDVAAATFDTADLRDIIAGTRGFGMVARYADRLAIHRPTCRRSSSGR